MPTLRRAQPVYIAFALNRTYVKRAVSRLASPYQFMTPQGPLKPIDMKELFHRATRLEDRLGDRAIENDGLFYDRDKRSIQLHDAEHPDDITTFLTHNPADLLPNAGNPNAQDIFVNEPEDRTYVMRLKEVAPRKATQSNPLLRGLERRRQFLVDHEGFPVRTDLLSMSYSDHGPVAGALQSLGADEKDLGETAVTLSRLFAAIYEKSPMDLYLSLKLLPDTTDGHHRLPPTRIPLKDLLARQDYYHNRIPQIIEARSAVLNRHFIGFELTLGGMGRGFDSPEIIYAQPNLAQDVPNYRLSFYLRNLPATPADYEQSGVAALFQKWDDLFQAYTGLRKTGT